MCSIQNHVIIRERLQSPTPHQPYIHRASIYLYPSHVHLHLHVHLNLHPIPIPIPITISISIPISAPSTILIFPLLSFTIPILLPRYFGTTDFKLTDNLPDGQRFPHLKVFAVSELVNYGLPGEKAPSIEKFGGVHLPPAEYHKKLEEVPFVMGKEMGMRMVYIYSSR